MVNEISLRIKNMLKLSNRRQNSPAKFIQSEQKTNHNDIELPHDLTWTYIKPSYNVFDIIWMCYVHSI